MTGLRAADLRKYKYFAGLSDASLEYLSEKLELVHYPTGSQLIKEGTVGDFFFFVKEGQLEVTKKMKSGQEEKISVIGSGQAFGELALLTCSVRSTSVRAITGVAVYRLSKKDFEDIILEESAFKDMVCGKAQEYTSFQKIKSLQPFELLPASKVYALLEKVVVKKYAPGENIIVQGEKGDTYYIIKSGKVAVLKKKKDGGDLVQVALLDDGQAFGEEALIRDDPRNATCQAVTETDVLVLSKKDFDQIVKSSFLDFVYPEDISVESYLDEYVIIDARIPPEYEEEHIHGAVNVPVENIRTQCEMFDRSKKYVTYCLNDSRGMVAAFLLRNRGYDAKCLRGGISGWEGPLVTGSEGIYRPVS